MESACISWRCSWSDMAELIYSIKREKRIVGVGFPPPGFFVSVADKGLRFSVSFLESTLTNVFAGIDSKWFMGAECLQERKGVGGDGFEGVRNTRLRASMVTEPAEIAPIFNKASITFWYRMSSIIISGLDCVG